MRSVLDGPGVLCVRLGFIVGNEEKDFEGGNPGLELVDANNRLGSVY